MQSFPCMNQMLQSILFTLSLDPCLSSSILISRCLLSLLPGLLLLPDFLGLSPLVVCVVDCFQPVDVRDFDFTEALDFGIGLVAEHLTNHNIHGALGKLSRTVQHIQISQRRELNNFVDVFHGWDFVGPQIQILQSRIHLLKRHLILYFLNLIVPQV